MKRKRNLTSHPLKAFPTPNPKSRSRHKAAIEAAKKAVEVNRLHPEPMSLFHRREKNGEVSNVASRKGVATRGEIEKAAFAMAAWDSSDPFAYGRTALHVEQGFLNSDEVVKEMSHRTLARQAAKRKEVDDAKSSHA